MKNMKLEIGTRVTVKNEGVNPQDHMHGDWFVAEVVTDSTGTNVGIARTKQAAINEVAEWWLIARRIEVVGEN